jgi:hypothetical protein
MAETVNVPGIGPARKPLVLGGLAVLAVILGIAWYRHSKNKAAAATDQGLQQDPNAIDPATGLTYGEEAAGIASGTLAGAGTPYGDTSGLIGYDAQGQPIYADTVGYGPAPSFTTNANWAQGAESYLVATTGADAGVVAAALGTYIAGQPLTDAQAQIVQSAIAFFGQPPQAGSNGYPPSLKLSGQPGSTGGSTGSGGPGDSGSGSGGTGGTGGTGGSTGGPITVIPRNLHVSKLFTNSVQVAWSAPAIPAGQGPLTGYGCECYDSAGHRVNGPFKVPPSQHFANFGGLKSKTRYHADIWCDPARTGGPHATVSFTTR